MKFNHSKYFDMKRIFTIVFLISLLAGGTITEARSLKKTSKARTTQTRKSNRNGYTMRGNRIVTQGKWVVIDFYTDWCKFCPPYKEIFDRVSKRFSGKAIFIRINAEKHEGIANYYNVTGYPQTVVLYPNDGGVATVINGMVEENYLYKCLSRYF